MRLCLLDIWYKGNLGSFSTSRISVSTKWLSQLKAAGQEIFSELEIFPSLLVTLWWLG